MNKLILFTCLLTVGLFFNSCKDDEDAGDQTAPVIDITQPTDGATIAVADLLMVRGTITDDVALKEISLATTLGLTDSFTTFDSEDAHNLAYDINLDPATPAGDYTITITATDSSDNQSSTTITVTVQ